MSESAETRSSADQSRLAADAEVCVIGLGNMGMAIARRLLASGFTVRGYDPVAGTRSALGAEGGQPMDDPRSCARGAAVLILLLPNSAIVEAALLRDGVLEAMDDGAYLLDMGSSDPLRTRALGAIAAERGIEYVDAPVSGGVVGADNGTLTIMVGSSEAQFAYLGPLLNPLATKVLHVGELGAGHALKALNNLLSATNMLVTSEAMLVGASFGLDERIMLEVLNHSSGRSFATELKFPRYVLSGTFDSGFSTHLMAKDALTASALARELGHEMRLGALSADLWRTAADSLPADADHTEIARWVSLP